MDGYIVNYVNVLVDRHLITVWLFEIMLDGLLLYTCLGWMFWKNHLVYCYGRLI